MAFASSQCRLYCFSSKHSSEQCCGAPDITSTGRSPYGPSDSALWGRSVPTTCPTYTPRPQKPKICWEWNHTHCTFPACQYIHTCLSCHGNPHILATVVIIMLIVQEAETAARATCAPFDGNPLQTPLLNIHYNLDVMSVACFHVNIQSCVTIYVHMGEGGEKCQPMHYEATIRVDRDLGVYLHKGSMECRLPIRVN